MSSQNTLLEYLHLNQHAGTTVPATVPAGEPIGGVDVRCGPILRLSGTHERQASYRGSLMIVVKDMAEVPEVRYHTEAVSEARRDGDGEAPTEAAARNTEVAGVKVAKDEEVENQRHNDADANGEAAGASGDGTAQLRAEIEARETAIAGKGADSKASDGKVRENGGVNGEVTEEVNGNATEKVNGEATATATATAPTLPFLDRIPFPNVDKADAQAAEADAPAAPAAPAAAASGTFPATVFHTQSSYTFIRYDINLALSSHETLVRYAINNDHRLPFTFYVPSATQSMNVMSFSCNGFSLGTDASTFPSSLWLDVLNKHHHQHYHVMLGGGDQIYSDAVKLHLDLLKKWTEEANPLRKHAMKATPELRAQLDDFYLDHYLAWFGRGFWQGTNGRTLQALFPVAMALIPSINIYDDHDIIDGFGSYRDSTMANEVFLAVGNAAYVYYMLFQHHTSPDEALHESDPQWILSKHRGPFIKQRNHSNYVRLGRDIAVLGLDCRTERRLKEVVTPDTYARVFDRLQREITAAPEIKHLLVMLGVPALYPRLVWLEWILTSKMLYPVRKLAMKGVIAKGLVNEFDGSVEVLDDLNDHWCSKHHKHERNQLIKDLLTFGAAHGVRITLLSGDVHLCCIGRLRANDDVLPENDPRLMFNVVSSAIVNTPPPDAMATLLNRRTKTHRFDRATDEDVVPLFTTDVDGHPRDNHRFLNRRNWSDLVVARQSHQPDDSSDVVRKLPQIIHAHPESKTTKHTSDPTYPLFSDSLVATLHVEQDPADYSAATTAYEVVIPRLDGTHTLEAYPVKHLR